jgi:hypothetical protein
LSIYDIGWLSPNCTHWCFIPKINECDRHLPLSNYFFHIYLTISFSISSIFKSTASWMSSSTTFMWSYSTSMWHSSSSFSFCIGTRVGGCSRTREWVLSSVLLTRCSSAREWIIFSVRIGLLLLRILIEHE